MQFCLLGSAMRARRRSLARCASCGMRSREGGVAAAHGLPLRLVLHCQLVDGAFPNTVTSTVENTAPLTLGSKQCRLVDIPGHERLRASLLDKFAASASKIVFVIDAISFPSQALNVAEWAYQVLTHPAMSKVPILFACNKQEVVTADTPRNIQNRLQEELETLRSTQSGQLISTDGTTIARSLGVEGEAFSFDQLEQTVDFIPLSVQGRVRILPVLSDVYCRVCVDAALRDAHNTRCSGLPRPKCFCTHPICACVLARRSGWAWGVRGESCKV
eukprot:m.230284 g.230284  ORF g.230284 m.230284 type:complete len:274 (+) comp10868_c0_seq12:2209-3030(+)